jgi:WD40 repeat protein
MDSFGSLKLKWANGYQGNPFYFVDNDTLVYSSGSILNFIYTSGTHLMSLPSHGKGIGPIAVSPEASLIAYSEASLEPLIYVLTYPKCSIKHTLKGNAKLEYKCLKFSNSGHKLVSFSGIPDFLLTIWDLNDDMVICETAITQRVSDFIDISVNPNNWKQLCVLDSKWMSLWTVESCDSQIMMTSIDVDLPEKDTPVGSLLQAHASFKDKETTEQPVEIQGIVSNMSTVLYTMSYDERVRKVCPVVPVTHCWTAHGSIYIGCEGGQILLTDFDSGTIKILVNPSIGDDNENVTEGSRDGPTTGHALLCPGAVNSIALSPRGLLTAGKDGRIYCFEQSNKFNIIDDYKLNEDIVDLKIYQNAIAIGTKEHSMYKLDLNEFSQPSLINVSHTLSPITIDMLSPGIDICLTCQQDGILYLWDMASGKLLSKFNFQIELTAMVCPISSNTAVMGMKNGCLLMINLVDIQSPKVVKKQKLFQDPVKILKTDSLGQFIITSSVNDKLVFVCSARPEQELQVLGHTEVNAPVQDISVFSDNGENGPFTRIAILSHIESCTVITLFELLGDLNGNNNDDVDELYTDTTKAFNDKVISKRQIRFTDLRISSMTLATNNSIFVTPKRLKSLYKMLLPNDSEKIIEMSSDDLLKLSNYPTHELIGATYCLSFHQKWLISVGKDGKLLTRLVEKPDSIVQCIPHHYKKGGGNKVVVSKDGQYLITIGDKGTMTCWKWNLTSYGQTKINATVQHHESKMQSMKKVIEKQNTFVENMNDVDYLEDDKQQTWFEIAVEEARKAEDEKYAELKAKLRNEIEALREKVLSMIAVNETLPDIEKLSRSEFILDTEEHQQHQKEEEKQVASKREQIELENLSKMYLRDLIKQQCWDAMTIKGKSVKAFQSRIKVHNYALKSQSADNLKELERVKILRKIEIAERKEREGLLNKFKNTTKTFVASLDIELDDDEAQTKNDETQSEPYALYGSRASEYGASVELLYDQFELLSPVAKRHQIILLKDCIYSIKENFNKEFDEILQLKSVEISRIQEKNARIKKIAQDLKLDEEIIVPTLDSDEEPERLLTVTDKEIKVERYISPEEKERLEKAAKEEEERKLREMGDNWRERGLDMMMGGRLEINTEEELFKDLPRPDFMDKDPVDLTEDEIRLKHDFEKKEAAWLEEREKLKKALEAEMKKHQEVIAQSLQAFDDKVMKLFQMKINAEKTVIQEELKILRLSVALLVEEEIKVREDELEGSLTNKKNEKFKLSNMLMETKRKVDEYQEYYEQIMSEDKELERNFRKDFADCDPHTDVLFKLFRRRPRIQKLKLEGGGGGIPLTKSDQPSHDSLTHKPSGISGVGSVTGPVGEIMSELDNPINMPDGLKLYQWERFVTARHHKVESERKLKEVAMNLAEMNSFLRRREKEDDRLQDGIQNAYMLLNKFVHV